MVTYVKHTTKTIPPSCLANNSGKQPAPEPHSRATGNELATSNEQGPRSLSALSDPYPVPSSWDLESDESRSQKHLRISFQNVGWEEGSSCLRWGES